MLLLKKFHPISFDVSELTTVGNAYCEICYPNGVRYERINHTHVKEVRYFKDHEEIEKEEYEQAIESFPQLSKNKIPFIWDYHVCFLDIYLLPNYHILPIVSIEFGSNEEMIAFVKPEWFGDEVNLRFYDEENMWASIMNQS